MCGKGKGNNPFGSFHEWQDWHQKWAADPLGLGLTDYSGNLVSKAVGEPTVAERPAIAAAEEARQQKRLQDKIAASPNTPPPQVVAIINPSRAVQDKRRRAILAARSSLTNPFGANTPLY